jgi:predicted permease
VLTYAILLPEAKYRDGTSWIAFFEQHLARLHGLPEVESASAATVLPFSGQHTGYFFEPQDGLPGGPDAKSPVVLVHTTFPGYFETMGIAIQSGHAIYQTDRHNVIVNETLARLFWPGQDAVGKHLRTRGSKDFWLEVSAVARDVRHYGLESEVRPEVYAPFHATPQSSVGIVVRTRGDPAAFAPTVRTLLREQDPTLPVAGLATMEDRIKQSLLLRRTYSSMTATFALIAVAMAMAGLYGIIAYVVGRRLREFGIRLALGARVRDLRRLVVGEGVRLAAVGVILGVIGGVLAGFGLRGLLWGVSPLDPLVLLCASGSLSALVITACLGPARRAARVNPIKTLHVE